MSAASSQPILHQHGPEVQEYGTVRLFPLGLSYETRMDSSQQLNHLLADTQILYSPYKSTTGSCGARRSTNCTCC